MTAHDLEDRIRGRAYALWDKAGRPGGQDKDYWALAEKQLAEEGGLDISEDRAQGGTIPLPAGLPIH